MTLNLRFSSLTSPFLKIEQIGPWGRPEFYLRSTSVFPTVFLSKFELCTRAKHRPKEEGNKCRHFTGFAFLNLYRCSEMNKWAWPDLFSMFVLCVSLVMANEWEEAFFWPIAVNHLWWCYKEAKKTGLEGVDHRLNMEVDIQSLFGLNVTWCAQLYSLAETPQHPLSPRIGTRIRGRYWSAKIDDISL